MYCDKCMGEIYKENYYYSVENENWCEDCFEKYQDDERKRCMKVAGE